MALDLNEYYVFGDPDEKGLDVVPMDPWYLKFLVDLYLFGESLDSRDNKVVMTEDLLKRLSFSFLKSESHWNEIKKVEESLELDLEESLELEEDSILESRDDEVECKQNEQVAVEKPTKPEDLNEKLVALESQTIMIHLVNLTNSVSALRNDLSELKNLRNDLSELKNLLVERGPGRLRKLVDVNIRDSEDSSMEPKRGRGRPRKIRMAEAIDQDSESISIEAPIVLSSSNSKLSKCSMVLSSSNSKLSKCSMDLSSVSIVKTSKQMFDGDDSKDAKRTFQLHDVILDVWSRTSGTAALVKKTDSRNSYVLDRKDYLVVDEPNEDENLTEHDLDLNDRDNYWNTRAFALSDKLKILPDKKRMSKPYIADIEYAKKLNECNYLLNQPLVLTRKTLNELFEDCLKQIKSCDLDLPKCIPKFVINKPWEDSNKWIKGLDLFIEYPSIWIELTTFLNDLSLGVYENERSLWYESLMDKQRSEQEEKDLKYVKNRNSIPRCFPSRYSLNEKDRFYTRLIPQNDVNKQTSILNIKGPLRSEVLKRLNETILPKNLFIFEMDLRACHTGIFVGITPKQDCRLIRKAFEASDFWAIVLADIPSVPKKIVKTLFYQSLNGGDLSHVGAIQRTIVNQHSIDSQNAWQMAREIFHSQLVKELQTFQQTLAATQEVWLPFSESPFLGSKDPNFVASDKKHGSLLSSRIFVQAEMLLMLTLYEQILKSGAIPLCAEHDGLLILAPRSIDLGLFQKHIETVSVKLFDLKLFLDKKVL